jgi:hypothetical protein
MSEENLQFTPEFLRHACLVMQNRKDPKEKYHMAFDSKSTILGIVQEHRKQNPKMPPFDDKKYKLFFQIAENGSIPEGDHILNHKE